MEVQYPLKFRLQQEGMPLVAHCGVKEFMAEEGRAYLPFWLMQAVGVGEGGYLHITNVALPMATYFKIRPRKKLFIQLENPKNVLEVALREYTCITKGVAIRIPYSGRQFDIDVLEVRPETVYGAASIVEADVEIDFATPLDMMEEEAAREAKRAATAAASSSSSSSSAVAGAPLIISSPEGANAAARLRRIRAERRAKAKLRASEPEADAIVTRASGRVGDGPSAASSSSSSSSSSSAAAGASAAGDSTERLGSVPSKRSSSRGRAGSASRARASSRSAADDPDMPDRGALLISGTEGRRLRDSKRATADPDVAHLLSTSGDAAGTPNGDGLARADSGDGAADAAGFIGTGRSMQGRQAAGEEAGAEGSKRQLATNGATAAVTGSAGGDGSASVPLRAFAGVAYRPSGKAPLHMPATGGKAATKPTADKITAALGAAGGTCLSVGDLPPGDW